jgi:hypothetical protein
MPRERFQNATSTLRRLTVLSRWGIIATFQHPIDARPPNAERLGDGAPLCCLGMVSQRWPQRCVSMHHNCGKIPH